MPKTYGTVTTFTAGSVLTAAQLNTASTAINNLVVPSACRCTRSADVTVTPGASGFLLWDQEVYDTDSMHDTTTNTQRITVGTPGIYLIAAVARMTWTGTVTDWQMILEHVSGGTTTPIAFDYFTTQTGGVTRMIQLTTTWEAVANDYFHVRLQSATGGTGVTFLATSSPRSYFSATWIGRTS